MVYELEKLIKAQGYIQELAEGKDPFSVAELSEDSLLNNVNLSRCFYYVADILERIIRSGGRVDENEISFF